MIAVGLLALAAAALHCGAVPRAGVAERGEDGVWRGRAVDACRAAAGAGEIVFRGYDASTLASAERDDIAFLDDAERARAGIAATGPVTAHTTQVLIMLSGGARRDPRTLAGAVVCFEIGSAAEDALEVWASVRHIAIGRIGFQERDEMHDAFAVGRCAALAVDAADVPPGARMIGAPLSDDAIRAIRPR